MKQLIRDLIRPLAMVYYRYTWRRQNKHNTTTVMNKFYQDHVTVGKETYGPIEVMYDSGTGRLTIGNYCSIAKNVKFLLGGGHNYRRISTFPFQTKVYNGKGAASRNERIDIVVEDDVWIGYDCIVLAGAKIGKGCVIGARSVVTGTIPPYSIYVGNKVIKKRFSDEIIKIIEPIDYSKISHHVGDEYEDYCNEELKPESVNKIKMCFEQPMT